MVGLKSTHRTVQIFVGLSLVLVVGVLSYNSLGDPLIPPWEQIQVYLGLGSEINHFIIMELRLPRVVLAVLVGASLALSGAILQAIVKNPLASPDIIGITGGASVAAVWVLTFMSGIISIQWVPAAAFVGAIIIATLIYLLAWRKGVSPLRFVLVGIGLFTICQALIDLMLKTAPSYTLLKAKNFIVGSLYGAEWEHIKVLLPWFLLLIPCTLLFSKQMNVHQLGDEFAIGLGSRIQMERFLLFFLCTGLAGASISFVGAIGFIGLISPHAARMLVGSSHHAMLPVAALLGSIFLVGADLLGSFLLAPRELPAGVFTAVLGAPYFIYLLYRTRNRG